MQQHVLEVRTTGRGLYLVTQEILSALKAKGPLPEVGLLNCFITHTSASLVIQENASPSAREDLQEFITRLAPEHQDWHRHTDEGPDDTTSHLKASITQTSLIVPIANGRLALGVWQGIYVWEHRDRPHTRKIILTVTP